MYDEIYYIINEYILSADSIFSYLFTDILASLACIFIVLVPFLIVWIIINMLVRAFQ